MREKRKERERQGDSRQGGRPVKIKSEGKISMQSKVR